ncbi:asparagine synthase (glutamine-hydrolyzing) [Portibacter marinus]|uniref:asparagine synthase (glutamine-hydrolyzing) n=1 Tax=Portibacter marinus TaxID=2898660 RepID=UPI001F383418|nr:asparagine synthase (glutamine-hydrolyzing) [Portibacter marinus]
MCGIAGFIDYSSSVSDEDLVRMTDSIIHRGPDSAGYKVFNTSLAKVGLGHRRLSIIDISSSGSQPMTKHGLTIVYNGEVYNYKEIKIKLLKANYKFTSTSDTEVILSAYDYWGENCVKKFTGMFAFAIYDQTKDQIFLCRDRPGAKPLFLYRKDNIIMFSSELKAFHKCQAFYKSINKDAVNLYFQYGFVPSPITIFNHCTKVKPGSYLIINLKSRAVKEHRYWDPNKYVTNEGLAYSEKQLLPLIEEKLVKAINYRMVADVPVGVFLSGGYDSSLVTAVLQSDRTEKIKTFTIGFQDKRYDESSYARKVAEYLGTDHSSYICSKKDTIELIPKMASIFDEPFADSSAIPTLLVSKLTSKHVKVAISADGGDELFAGYKRNTRFLEISNSLNRIPGKLKNLLAHLISGSQSLGLYPDDLNRKLEKSKNLLIDISLANIFNEYSKNLTASEANFISNHKVKYDPQLVLGDPIESDDNLNKMLSVDYQSTLTNDMLVKVDRSTMHYSLEGREPLLDHELYEFVSSIPSDLKMKNGTLKYLLKEITHKYIPKEIMDRPKKGFGIPLNSWLKDDLNDMVHDYLNTKAIDKFDILDSKEVLSKVRFQEKYGKERNNIIWSTLMFQMWCEKWL